MIPEITMVSCFESAIKRASFSSETMNTISTVAGTTSGQTTIPNPERLSSLDAYRGFVMFLMLAEVLQFSRVSDALPGSKFWEFLGDQQSHVAWIGCALHDLIQPSFSFLVGVALPFSIANRLGRSQSRGQIFRHAIFRALTLILLGVFLRSTWTFEDTLSQIGLGYVFLFMLGFRPVRDQWIAFGVLLAGYWTAFALYPLPGPGWDYAKVGVTNDGAQVLSGFAAHWSKNSNLAWSFDTWFLNLFPRRDVFKFNGGGYATLSFIPTLATMVLGLIAGGILRRDWTGSRKVKWFAIAGAISLGVAILIGWLGICPVVKRIWTPAWVLFSGGWCLLLLASFYGIVDVLKFRAWAFPLIVIGMNSILAYCSEHLFGGFIKGTLIGHFSSRVFNVLGEAYSPILTGAPTLLLIWLLLYWMYRQKYFLRI